MIFVCPKCNHPQSCPCVHCQKSNPTEKPWVWGDQEIEQYEKWKKQNE